MESKGVVRSVVRKMEEESWKRKLHGREKEDDRRREI